MTDRINHADFGTSTFSGVVTYVEVVEGQYGEYLDVTMVHHVAKEDPVSITFNTSNGLLGLHKSGWLPAGRRVTITGRLRSVSTTFLDKKTGQTLFRKRPLLTMEEVSIPKGGLGAMPAEKAPATAPKRTVVVATPAPQEAPVDEAPQLQAVGPKPYGEGTPKDKNGFPQF